MKRFHMARIVSAGESGSVSSAAKAFALHLLDRLDDRDDQACFRAEVVDQHPVAGADRGGELAQAEVAQTVLEDVVDRGVQQAVPGLEVRRGCIHGRSVYHMVHVPGGTGTERRGGSHGTAAHLDPSAGPPPARPRSTGCSAPARPGRSGHRSTRSSWSGRVRTGARASAPSGSSAPAGRRATRRSSSSSPTAGSATRCSPGSRCGATAPTSTWSRATAGPRSTGTAASTPSCPAPGRSSGASSARSSSGASTGSRRTRPSGRSDQPRRSLADVATVRPSTTPNPNAMKFTLDVTLAGAHRHDPR